MISQIKTFVNYFLMINDKYFTKKKREDMEAKARIKDRRDVWGRTGEFAEIRCS